MMVDNSVLSIIFNIFSNIWNVGNSITILGVGLWWYLFSLVIIWVLLSSFLAFVNHSNISGYVFKR